MILSCSQLSAFYLRMQMPSLTLETVTTNCWSCRKITLCNLGLIDVHAALKFICGMYMLNDTLLGCELDKLRLKQALHVLAVVSGQLRTDYLQGLLCL